MTVIGIEVCISMWECAHFNTYVSYSSCWGYSLINTLRFRKKIHVTKKKSVFFGIEECISACAYECVHMNVCIWMCAYECVHMNVCIWMCWPHLIERICILKFQWTCTFGVQISTFKCCQHNTRHAIGSTRSDALFNRASYCVCSTPTFISVYFLHAKMLFYKRDL